MSIQGHMQSHVAAADAITAAATAASTFGWWVGIVPGFVSLAVGILGCIWYSIQIIDSPWFKNRQRRLHRRRARKARRHGSR